MGELKPRLEYEVVPISNFSINLSGILHQLTLDLIKSLCNELRNHLRLIVQECARINHHIIFLDDSNNRWSSQTQSLFQT